MNMKSKTILSTLNATRKVNKYFQQNPDTDFKAIAQLLSGLVDTDIIITDNTKNILACCPDDSIKSDTLPKEYLPLISKNTLGNIIIGKECCTAVPVICQKEPVYTIIAVTENTNSGLKNNQIMILENTTALIALKLSYKTENNNQNKALQSAKIQAVLNVLSYSEIKSIIYILGALEGKTEGILITSKIADKVGLTRSVVVNALRKLESATFIETRSLGMKGTFIKILNPLLLEEINKKHIMMA